MKNNCQVNGHARKELISETRHERFKNQAGDARNFEIFRNPETKMKRLLSGTDRGGSVTSAAPVLAADAAPGTPVAS